jgi:hypothetical protein
MEGTKYTQEYKITNKNVPKDENCVQIEGMI